MKFIINLFVSFSLLLSFSFTQLHAAGEMKEPMHPDWSFEGPLGKFERASLQRGYQVYTEVCSGCHSMNLLIACVFIKQSKPPCHCNLRSPFLMKTAGIPYT
jgi:hypothetical protein